jgi:hypothetical protein
LQQPFPSISPDLRLLSGVWQRACIENLWGKQKSAQTIQLLIYRWLLKEVVIGDTRLLDSVYPGVVQVD